MWLKWSEKNISMKPSENWFSYLPFKNFDIFSKHLKEKTFSIFHLNVESLNKNIDKLKEFRDALNGR